MKKIFLSCIALSTILVSCKDSKADKENLSKPQTETAKTNDTSPEERNKAKFFELVEAEIRGAYNTKKYDKSFIMDEEFAKEYREDAEFFFNQNKKLTYSEAFDTFKEHNPGPGGYQSAPAN